MENLEILNKIIIGRVEPHIYAFSTETVPNYLKVGDTYRPIEMRLNEWRKYFPNLEKQYSEIAKASDKFYFRDYAVHSYLQLERNRNRLPKSAIPNIPYYSNEFFENATIQDIKDAIADIKKNLKSENKKYQFYSFDESLLPIIEKYDCTETFLPRKNQQDTIDNFNAAIANGRTNLLMYAVMRFGKTFTSMCCATEMDAKLVVIVSGKADVREEWKKCVESHQRFKDYLFLSSNDLYEDNEIVSKTLENKKVTLFLTLQDLQGEDIKDKHIDIFGRKIDLLIVDETHFAARADQLGQVLNTYDPKEYKLQQKEIKDEVQLIAETDKTIKSFSTKIRLHLSGTPYRILMGSEFKPEDVIAFCQFTDILRDQERWDNKHLNEDNVKEWDNPYYGFPQMIRFAFNPNKSSIKKMDEMKHNKDSYTLSELLRPQSTEKKRDNSHKNFKNEREVLDLLEVIDGSKYDENILGFLDYNKIKAGKMCRHIVCVLPFRAACDALEELIKNNNSKFKNLGDYDIINIAGLDSPKTYNSTNAIKAKIKECETTNKKSITLTVNRMLTGTTVEEWDTMIYLKDTASPQEYDQAIFRLQNQYIREYIDDTGDAIKYNMKPQTLLVDFSPNRMFYMQEQKSQFYNVNTDKSGNNNLRERINEELNFSPIITINSGKISQVTPTDLMSEIRKYTSDKSVIDEAIDIPIDLNLMGIDILRNEIDNQPEIGSKEGLKTKAVEGDGEELDIPDNDNNDSTQSIRPTIETSNDDDEAVWRKKFATYYSRILFYAFLSKSNVKSLRDIITSIDIESDNIRIANNLGLKKDIVELFLSMNPFVLSKLDYKVENLNALSNDTSLDPIERVENAMNKFGRISESEITTPKHIASNMVDLFPVESFNKNTKILDIASKQGEFATALINKFGEIVKENIYSIVTSPIAYEFTRKVYETLEMPVENIFKEFTSYDIIKEENTEIIDKLKNMKLDIIIGNPPYQIMDGGGMGSSALPIYNKFVLVAKKLTQKYTSMITPSRWFSGGRGLDEFRQSMLQENKMIELNDFINASHCFPDVEIKGGISFFLWGKNYDGDCKITTVLSNSKLSTANRPLMENGTDIFIRYNEAIPILKKVQIHKDVSFSTLISANDPFGFDVREENSYKRVKPKYKLSPDPDSVSFYYNGWRKNGIGYVNINSIRKNQELVNKYKILVPKAWGVGDMANDWLKPFIIAPNSCCTETYLVVGSYDNENTANNVIKYTQTRFFHFMLFLKKITQNTMQEAYKFVPLQDFSQTSDIDWCKSIKEIDQQLYKKYNLNPDEIAFIESTIKPM
ncbi:MAG: Eco57I restriction-modification methylase domain-containing protein [bacterium]